MGKGEEAKHPPPSEAVLYTGVQQEGMFMPSFRSRKRRGGGVIFLSIPLPLLVFFEAASYFLGQRRLQ